MNQVIREFYHHLYHPHSLQGNQQKSSPCNTTDLSLKWQRLNSWKKMEDVKFQLCLKRITSPQKCVLCLTWERRSPSFVLGTNCNYKPTSGNTAREICASNISGGKRIQNFHWEIPSGMARESSSINFFTFVQIIIKSWEIQ